jgi:hypothetical protein
MSWRPKHIAAAVSAFCLVAPAAGVIPILPPPHARYGPVTYCLGGYGVEAGASEAILAMETGATLFSDNYGFHFTLERGRYDRNRAVRSEVAAGSLGVIERQEHRIGDRTNYKYRLPERAGSPAVVVNSGDFDGSDRDIPILARLLPIAPEDERCRLFAAPHFIGHNPDARTWRPAVRGGPLHLCHNGLSFGIRAGEGLQLPYVKTVGKPRSRLLTGQAKLDLSGPEMVATEEMRAAGIRSYRLSRHERADGVTLYLVPPRSISRRLPRQEQHLHFITIEASAKDEPAAREFVKRLELIDGADPRCTATRDPK